MSVNSTMAEWSRCRDWLVAALVDATEAQVIGDLQRNRAQIWGGDRAAMVTKLMAGEEPYVLLWLGGGELRDLLALGAGVAAWARAQGARAAVVNGRNGWARALKSYGFQPDGEELRKTL